MCLFLLNSLQYNNFIIPPTQLLPRAVGTVIIWSGRFLDLPVLRVAGHVVAQLRLVHKVAATMVAQVDLQKTNKGTICQRSFTWFGWSECTWTASSFRFSVWKPQLGMRHSYFMDFPSFAWAFFLWMENPFWVTKFTSHSAHRYTASSEGMWAFLVWVSLNTKRIMMTNTHIINPNWE